MCYKYRCDACKRANCDFCKEYLVRYEAGERSCGKIEVEHPWGSKLKRCYSCYTIVGAVTALKALVLREPWLLTAGVAGAPKKAAWELEGVKEKEVVSDDEDEIGEADGWTKEEREKLRGEAEEAVMRRWCLMAAEQAAEKEAQ